MQGIFIKKCFFFTVGRVFRVKRYTAGSRNVADVSLMTKRLKRRYGSGWHNSQCGFRRTGKAMGQEYQCWFKISREINVYFQFRISHVLCFIFICDIFTDSDSYYSPFSGTFCFHLQGRNRMNMLIPIDFVPKGWGLQARRLKARLCKNTHITPWAL
jgi:hypothetical protein